MARITSGVITISFIACLASCAGIALAQEPSPKADATSPVSLEEAGRLETKATAAWKAHKYVNHSKLLETALAIREKIQGPEHLDVANCLAKLGSSYRELHRAKEGEAVLKRSLAIREKILGHDHLLVAESFDSLAGFYIETRGIQDSMLIVKAFGEALEIKKRVAGPESVEVSDSLHNIGAFSYAVLGYYGGKYTEKDLPERMLRRALEIREKTLGPDDPKVAETLIILALSLSYHKQNAEAEAMAKRALAIFEKAQGPQGSDVARCLDVYARMHWKNGKDVFHAWKESRELNRRAKAIREKDDAVKRAGSGAEPH